MEYRERGLPSRFKARCDIAARKAVSHGGVDRPRGVSLLDQDTPVPVPAHVHMIEFGCHGGRPSWQNIDSVSRIIGHERIRDGKIGRSRARMEDDAVAAMTDDAVRDDQ